MKVNLVKTSENPQNPKAIYRNTVMKQVLGRSNIKKQLSEVRRIIQKQGFYSCSEQISPPETVKVLNNDRKQQNVWVFSMKCAFVTLVFSSFFQ